MNSEPVNGYLKFYLNRQAAWAGAPIGLFISRCIAQREQRIAFQAKLCYYYLLCLLTIYRLPFQVSGRVSDGLILDSFSQKFLVKRSVRIANCLRA